MSNKISIVYFILASVWFIETFVITLIFLEINRLVATLLFLAGFTITSIFAVLGIREMPN